jgi:predicted metal-dependent peptidase
MKAGRTANLVTDSLREKWERAVIQAAQAAKASGQGNLPSDLQRELEKIQAVQIDWRAETADFVKNSIATKNDWTRGNRRMLWQSVVYPSRRRDNCGLIIGVRDTSGSISDETAAQFSAILASACAELGAELLLIDCDAEIQAEYRIAPGEDVPLTAKGGGGTDFAAPFARAADLIANGENVAGLIYLTDLCGSGWPVESPVPTLCICTENSQAPSGRTVQLL